MKHIPPVEFDFTVRRLREFFSDRGFLEVHPQSRLSILAACEDPTTIATFDYNGAIWPLPQTGQMWLEHELLKDPSLPGVFCVTTSFRNEPNPIPGRHDLIFPMFEFESHGNIESLKQMERELCDHLGFGSAEEFAEITYEAASAKYDVPLLGCDEETMLQTDFGDVVLLTNFPERTSPFWNMRRFQGNQLSKKVDVIIHGIETIGSAERSIDPDDMRNRFHTISNGMYANLLYAKFGKTRVLHELEEFLSYDFFPRVGGGIGLTRMIRALKLSNILITDRTKETISVSA